MFLVVGLGNPGRKYENTRHNAGFLVADRLAARFSATCDKPHMGALTARIRIGDTDVAIAKPQSYMNLSGQAAVSLRGYYKLVTTDVIVVHDDLDIAFGQVRIKVGGGHGGHNGLRDIHARFGGDGGYSRVRFGIGRPPEGWNTADYVLTPWGKAELAELEALVDRATDAVEGIVRQGANAAMNTFNVRAG